MSTSILTSNTVTQLNRAITPEGVKWFDVPDSRLMSEQQDILTKVKEIFGAEQEQSTFCIGESKDGERIIVQPKLNRKGDSPAVHIGKNSYVTSVDGFEIHNGNLVADVHGYLIPIGFVNIQAIDGAERTPTQLKYSLLENVNDKLAFIRKLPSDKLVELLRQPGAAFVKLAALEPGEYVVTKYESKSSQYGLKYVLTLEDGRVLDGNSAIKEVCKSWVMDDVVVSKKAPAKLIVGSSYPTKTGNTVVRIQLYSPIDLTLPIFDFSGATEATMTQEEAFGFKVPELHF